MVHLGPVDPTTATATASDPQPQGDPEKGRLIDISLCLNLDGIELDASRLVSPRALHYFRSAADSLASAKANREDWSKIVFRSRVLRDVTQANMQQKILGQKSSLPIFIAPAGMAKLAHPDGELCLARGAARKNMPYCGSGYASTAPHESPSSLVSFHHP